MKPRLIIAVIVVATVGAFSFWLSEVWEKPTTVKISGRNPPDFRLRGSGELAYFVVYSPSFPQQTRVPFLERSLAIWLVSATHEQKRLEAIATIRYGVVPNGYTQEIPSAGSPEPLVEGKKYFFEFDTRDAVGTSGYVEIIDGKAAAVEGEHVCFGGEGNQWIRKPCREWGY